MNKCREEFEKLPEIVEILSSGYYYFLEDPNEYNSDVEGVITDTIDLAWCLYQKQQKQIDYLNKCHTSRVAELVRLNQVKADRLVDLQKRVDDLEQAIQHCFEVDEVMRMKFEKIYKETDGNYLHVLDRYDTETDSYPNNDYVQMRYEWFRAGSESRQSKLDEFKKGKSLQELEINQLAQANQQWKLLNDELKKKLDAVKLLLPSLKAENDLWGCEQVQKQLELLEQAMK